MIAVRLHSGLNTPAGRAAWTGYAAAHPTAFVIYPGCIDIDCASGREADELLARLVDAGIPRAALRIVEPPPLSARDRLRAASRR